MGPQQAQAVDAGVIDFLKSCFRNDDDKVALYASRFANLRFYTTKSIVNGQFLDILDDPPRSLKLNSFTFFDNRFDKAIIYGEIKYRLDNPMSRSITSVSMQSTGKESPQMMEFPKAVSSHPWLANVEKFVYYTKVDTRSEKNPLSDIKELKNCGVQLNNHREILTYRHLQHSCLKEGDQLNVYSAVMKPIDSHPIEARVKHIDAKKDYVVLEATRDLPYSHINLPVCGHQPCRADKFMLLGYPEESRLSNELSVLRGSIETESVNEHGQLQGSGSARPGYSGGPVFSKPDVLLGICMSGGPNASNISLADLPSRLTWSPYVNILPVIDVLSELDKKTREQYHFE